MKNVNKILALFLLVMSLSFLVVWKTLQSEWVAEKISKIGTQFIKQKMNADVRFDSLRFNFFPPGAEVKNFVVELDRDGQKIKSEINSVGVYFNPLNVLSTNFEIERVEIEDGYLSMNSVEAKNKKKIAIKKTENNFLKEIKLEKYFDLLSKVPINRVSLNNYKLDINNFQTELSDIDLYNGKTELAFKGNISNLIHTNVKSSSLVDEISLDLIIDVEKVSINKVILKEELSRLSLNGVVKNYLSKNANVTIEGNLKAPLEMIHDFVEMREIGSIYDGIGDFQFSTKGNITNLSTDINAKLVDVDTDFAYAQKVESKIKVTNESIRFLEFELTHNEQELKLLEPFEFFNLKTKKWVEEPIFVKAEKLESNNFLKYIKSSVDFLNINVSGNMKFDLFEKSYTFSTLDNLVVNKLLINPGEKDILGIKEISVESGIFNIEGRDFYMDVKAKKENSQFDISAEISKNNFEIKMKPSKLSFIDISPITIFDIKGESLSDFVINKNTAGDIILDINSSVDNFSFDHYYIDEVQTNIELNLSTNILKFKNLEGKSNKALLGATGQINLNNLSIDARYEISNLNYTETKKILNKYLFKVPYTSNDIHGNWNSEGSISGVLDPEKINVKGAVRGDNNYFFNESLDSFSMNYELDSLVLKVENFKGKKSYGTIEGESVYKINEEEVDIKASFNRIPLVEIAGYSKLPFNIIGSLGGSFNVGLKEGLWKGKGRVELSDTKVLSQPYQNSVLEFDVKDTFTSFKLNGFGKQLNISSFLNFEKNTTSSIELELNFADFKKMFGIIKGVDLFNSEITGSVNYKLKSTFGINDFIIKDVSSHVKKFTMYKKPIEVNYTSNEPEILVKDSIVKQWDMAIRGKKFYVLSKGSGDLSSEYDILTNTKIDASIIEVFNTYITKANGNLRGKLLYKKTRSNDEYQALITSDNLSLSTTLLPTTITKANMKISFEDKVLKVNQFIAQLINGNFELGGSVDLNNFVPEIDLRYKFVDAGISVLKKSNLTFSGDGSFVGKNFPYVLGGNFYIQKFILVNEISDFGKSEKNLLKSDIKYLPGKKQKTEKGFVDLNINVSTRDPIFITNSLADIGFNGNIQVLGGIKDPRLSGKISLAPRNNKITFKNNEFSFTKGNVFFYERNELANPELDFLATSTINKFKINVKVLGPVENFDFDLTSEPALSQSDILSLIAFGYTEDVSNNLTDAEKESMTRAGIGSMIFDSFKINETLKSEFGIQVNLGTEIAQDEKSLLSQRNASSTDEVGRVRSATTFEIKKQLSKAMSLSVSSTVGNSSTQKQSVNLNYNVDKKVSLEGVYESKSTDEVQTINDDTSFGADLKVKWSFK